MIRRCGARPAVLLLAPLLLAASCGLKGADEAGPGAGAGAGAAGGSSSTGAGAGSGGAATGATVDGGAPPSTPMATAAPATTVDPGSLPQTETKPVVDSREFQARLDALWQGIVTDDADKAMAFFFPLSAYKQVKGISDPVGDWNNRLVAIYKREVHDLHKVLGANAASAELLGMDVPSANAAWIKPGVEYNKGAYWRVLGSKVRYRVNGKTQSFVVQSMISWRGEWYVVHLTAPPR